MDTYSWGSESRFQQQDIGDANTNGPKISLIPKIVRSWKGEL